MLIAQVSDLHIQAGGKPAYGRVDTAGMLRRCVADLMRRDPLPDAVIATGDLVDAASPEAYAQLRELLAPLAVPLYLLAGNHDERIALRAAFPEPGFDYLRQSPDKFLQYEADMGPLRLLALDTLVPQEGRGRICERRLAWLDARLREDRRPTLLAMHHPPFATGVGHVDALGLEGAAALEQVVYRYPQVERLLCGHLHRAALARFAGTLASTCPSTAHQVALDLQPDAPACFVMEPPGYQLHHWTGGRLVTHTAVLGDFAQPFALGED